MSIVIVILLASLSQEASATFSIAAVDSTSQQIGAMGASCVPESVFDILYQGVPGRGIVMTQAMPPPEGSPVYKLSLEMLTNGDSPTDLLEIITDPDVDGNDEFLTNGTRFPGPTLRQYGVVELPLSDDRNFDGSVAGHTGEGIQAFYAAVGLTEDAVGAPYTQEHQGGQKYEYTYSTQGNIVGFNTISTLTEAFEFAQGETACDLADRLMMSFAAIFDANTTSGDDFLGDVRCMPLPSSSVFLHVDNPDGTEFIHIDIVEGENVTAGENPFVLMRETYDAWRLENPCPVRIVPSEAPTGAPSAAPTSPPTKAPTAAPEDDSSSATRTTSIPFFLGSTMLLAMAVAGPLCFVV